MENLETKSLCLQNTKSVRLLLRSDTGNNEESSTAQIHFQQDGGITVGKLGTVGDGTTEAKPFAGALQNSTFILSDSTVEGHLQFATNNIARAIYRRDFDGRYGHGTTNPAVYRHYSRPGDLTVLIDADTDNAGTTFPEFKLSKNNGDVTASLRFGGSLTGDDAGDNTLVLKNTSLNASADLILATGNQARMTITRNGNVDIANVGSVMMSLAADTSNLSITGVPILNLSKSGGNVSAELALNGNAGSVFTGSLEDALYLHTDSAAIPIQFATNVNARLTILGDGGIGIGTNAPAIGLDIQVGVANNHQTTTGSTTTDSDMYILGVTDTSSPRTIQLETSDVEVAGRRIIIKDESGNAGSGNPISITTQGSETIDDMNAIVINVDYGYVELYPDGTNWFTLGKRLT